MHRRTNFQGYGETQVQTFFQKRYTKSMFRKKSARTGKLSANTMVIWYRMLLKAGFIYNLLIIF
jgi:hypothetical protein